MDGYKVTIKVAPTLLNERVLEGGLVGHAFLTLSAPGRPDITIGYYPITEGAGAMPSLGAVRDDSVSLQDPRTDTLAEHNYSTTKTFLITEKQYAAMVQYAAQVANDTRDYYNALNGALSLPLTSTGLIPQGLTGSNVCTDFVHSATNKKPSACAGLLLFRAACSWQMHTS